MADEPFVIEPLDRPRAYRVSGSFGVPSAGSLPELLDELCRTPGDITLDLSGVTFIDSGGLRALIQACMGLGASGSVRIVRPSEQVRRLLKLSGVEANVDNLVVEP
ncbi:MAG TPA: STAS domain-containing protein [Actinomycetota bacterium]|nr:STAS domain-containing protein [Actinomycetota bacterium]